MDESDRLEVWLDAAWPGEMHKVGVLAHHRGTVRFTYDQAWLRHSAAFALDPELSLDKAPFFPKPEAGNFGVFLDSAPDRWGQMLMKRREALEAKDDRRGQKTLYAWDYLIGVQDETRQGALRFRPEGSTAFVSDHRLAAPPVTQLRELEVVAKAISAKRIDDLDALRRWLAVLVAPGASLGGARPKASFRQPDGTLWIAKFPSRDDDNDTGAWEGVTHTLAKMAGVDVPPAQQVRLSGEHHTFCVQRFDRRGGRRVFYASAMTMLAKEHSEGTSYLELAQFIQSNGSRGTVAQDLEQLFRRVVFNVAVANRDDHLRNHGFAREADGWRLAPAFDMNPTLDKAVHVLDLDDQDNRPDIDVVRATAPFYGLPPRQADQVISDVLGAVQCWADVARRAGIPKGEIALMAPAFTSCAGHGHRSAHPTAAPTAYFAITIDTSKAAFEDIGHNIELARLLDVAAEHLADAGATAPLVLVDTNGNTVGGMQRVAHEPEDAMERPIFRAVIPADGDAVQRLRDMAAEKRAAVAEAEHVATPMPPEGGEPQ